MAFGVAPFRAGADVATTRLPPSIENVRFSSPALVVVVAPPGPSRARCLTAARVAQSAGAAVLALCADGDGELGALAAETIALPDVEEHLSPIAAVVPLQLFAYHVALARGRNPDGRPLPAV